MIPFPQAPGKNPSLLTYVNPSHTFLLVNPEATKYAFLDSITDCQRVSESYHLCYLPTVSHNIDGPCELQLYLDTNTKNCNISFFYGQLDLTESLGNNEWLLAYSTSKTIRIFCNQTIQHMILPLTALFVLPNECYAQSGKHYFYPIRTFQSEFTTIIPTINISTLDVEPPLSPPVHLPTIKRINQMELLSLTDQLREEQHILNTHFITPTHFHWTTTIILSIIVIFSCIYMYFKYCTRRKQNQTTIINPLLALHERNPIPSPEPSPKPLLKPFPSTSTRHSTRNKKQTTFFAPS